MSNYSDFVGGSGGAVVGEIAEYPAISAAPDGYIKADGTIYPNACYSSLSTCYSNKLYTAAASIPFAGTTYNLAAWQPFIESKYSWGNCLCCWNQPNCLFTNTATACAYSQYINTRYSSCGYGLNSIYNGLCGDSAAAQCQSSWDQYLQMVGGSGYNWENGFLRLMTPCGVAVTPFAKQTDCFVTCRARGYIIWYQDPTWTNPVECILKNGTSYMRHKCDVWFACSYTNCVFMCAFGSTGTTICNHIIFGAYGRTSSFDVLTMLAETQNQPCVCKQRMSLRTKTDGSCNLRYVCGNEYCCQASGQPNHTALKANYLCGTTATACDSACPFVGVITRTLGSSVCCDSGTTCCDMTAGVFAYGGGADAWYTAPNCCCVYLGCTVVCDRVWPISRWIMNGAQCYNQCSITGIQPGVRMSGVHDYHWQLFSNSNQPCLTNTMPSEYRCRGLYLNGDHWSNNYDVGNDRFVTFGCLCFGVGVVDGGCNLTITCYPLSCVPGSSPVVKVCYSNPLNKFIATTEDNTVLISNGNSGHVWSCVCQFESGHHILSIRNLDNKVAIFAGSGAVLLSCDSSTWTYIFNRDKMIVGDRSAKLLKWNNYYIGAGSVYSCDLCCSGYSSAPGAIACSTTLGAIVSVNTPMAGSCNPCVPGPVDRKTCEDNSHAAEVAAYCANFTDSIYWKFCSLHSFCSTGPSAACRCNYFPIGGGVSETCDSVWALYRITCCQSFCGKLMVKRLPLSTCVECHYELGTKRYCNVLLSGCCNCRLLSNVMYKQTQTPGETFYYTMMGYGCACSGPTWQVGLAAHRGASYCNVTIFTNNRRDTTVWTGGSDCIIHYNDGVRIFQGQWCCNGICCDQLFNCFLYSATLRCPNTATSCFYHTHAYNCCCCEIITCGPRCHYYGCTNNVDSEMSVSCYTRMNSVTGPAVNIAGDGSNFSSLASGSESQYYLANVACPACGYCQTLLQGTGTIPVNPLLYHFASTTNWEGTIGNYGNFALSTRDSIVNIGVTQHNGSFYTTFGGPAPCFDTSACFQVPNCPGKFIKT